MLSYENAISTFNVTDTPRQKRKWGRGTGLAYKLAQKVTDDYVPSGADEIKFLTDSMTKPGPNPNKKEKRKRDGNRTSRKDKRNSRRREETQRQKTQKKNRWRKRKEARQAAA